MSYSDIKNYRQNRKQLLVDCLGGKCAKCGYDSCLAALDFHHINPLNKDFSLSRSIQDLDKCIKEVKKCVLLCCRCHRELHDGLWSINGITIPIFSDEVINNYINRNKEQRLCKLCNKKFIVNLSSKKSFCNEKCRRLFSRKVIRPTKENLSKEMQRLTWVELGKKYGVTDNAVRKWAKNYKLI